MSMDLGYAFLTEKLRKFSELGQSRNPLPTLLHQGVQAVHRSSAPAMDNAVPATRSHPRCSSLPSRVPCHGKPGPALSWHRCCGDLHGNRPQWCRQGLLQNSLPWARLCPPLLYIPCLFKMASPFFLSLRKQNMVNVFLSSHTKL